MATALEKTRLLSINGKDDNYLCDCGRKCSDQEDLDQHKLNNCKSPLLQCSFCQESQPSSTALRDHLMLCGNKTDQCPNCRKFIRRAIFAYHYENNCANLEEIDTPTPRSRNSSAHRPSSKSSKSVSRKNDVDDHDQENNSPYDSSNYRSKPSDRISSATSNKRSSSNIIECEFCKNQCARSDYEDHKKSCLQNVINLDKKRQRKSSTSNQTESRPSISERGRSPDSVHIPCEFCNEQIDLRLWSTHVQNCREQEIRRIEDRAQAINQEPVIEQLPCEHCEKVFSGERLQAHEIACRKNPENMARAARIANTQSSVTIGLSNKSPKTDRDPTLPSIHSSLPLSSMSGYNHSPPTKDIPGRIKDREQGATLHNERFTSHVTLNMKQAQEIPRPRDNNASALAISGHQPPKQQRASDDSGLQLINSSADVPAYGTLPLLLNDRLSSGTQSLPRRIRGAESLDRASVERTSLNRGSRDRSSFDRASPNRASLNRESRDRQSKDHRPMPPREPSPVPHAPRSQSASIRSPNARGSQRPDVIKATNHLLVNDNLIFNSPREEDRKHQPKLHQRDRPTTSSNKPKTNSSFYNPNAWK